MLLLLFCTHYDRITGLWRRFFMDVPRPAGVRPALLQDLLGLLSYYCSRLHRSRPRIANGLLRHDSQIPRQRSRQTLGARFVACAGDHALGDNTQ